MTQSSKLAWYQLCPLVNLVYDFLFDDPPTADLLEKTLNAFALVCALMLSVVLGVPGSFSVDELENANERYREAALNGYCSLVSPGDVNYEKYGAKYSDRLLHAYHMATVFMSISLLITVLVYTFLSTHDFAKDTKGFECWWKYSKFLVAMIFSALVVGLYFTYLTFLLVVEGKYPRGCMVKLEDRGTWNSGYYTGASYYEVQLYAISSSLGFALLVLSIATASRYKCNARDPAMGKVDVNGSETITLDQDFAS